MILGTGAHVRVIGMGRKERFTPIAKPTLTVLKARACAVMAGAVGWPQRGDGNVLFPSAR